MTARTTYRCRLLGLAALCAAGIAILAGCDYSDSGSNDHKPPAGMGSLIIYDNTSDDIRVYIDGSQTNDVPDYDDRAYDLNPGVHRVVLDQRGGERTFSSDVDILEGRRTVMDVNVDPGNGFDYDVAIFLD